MTWSVKMTYEECEKECEKRNNADDNADWYCFEDYDYPKRKRYYYPVDRNRFG